ncbi:alkaline phosphatase, partial [Bacteroides uniformis]
MKKLVYTLFFVLISVVANGQAKYVFYFIGDGMGVNQVNGTEMYQAEIQNGRIGVEPLLFTQFPVATVATTFSAKNSVTDSAAAGTALATGKKTYNHAISVGEDKNAIQTVAEKAKKAGKKVGVTTSVSVDHATPAAFYAHQPDRNMNYEIALDLPKANFDFYAGGGFLKPTTTYDKKEAPSIFPIFEEAGYTVARGYNDYKAKAAKAEKMILIQEEGANPSCLPYAIDRKENDLTLAQITESAIDFLTKGNNKGFFLMVEGGKIDWACHSNDAATAFHEVMDMDNAIIVAYEFYEQHPDETLIVVTTDHETGGIVLGKGPYTLNLQALKSQKVSESGYTKIVNELRKKYKNQVPWEVIKQSLKDNFGFWDSIQLNEKQEASLKKVYDESFSGKEIDLTQSEYQQDEPLAAEAKRILDDIALVGWTSGGHSGGYVPVFAIGAGAQLFQG